MAMPGAASAILAATPPSQMVIAECVKALWAKNVVLKGCLIKPQMVVPGEAFAGPNPSPRDVAQVCGIESSGAAAYQRLRLRTKKGICSTCFRPNGPSYSRR